MSGTLRLNRSWRVSALVLVVLSAAVFGTVAVVGCGDDGVDWTTASPLYQTGKSDSKGRPILVPGDFCPEVEEIQRSVNALEIEGVELAENGEYDDPTLAVILAFQYSQGLQPDGVIGTLTWDAIEDPQKVPDHLDPLTLVQIGQVALDSPSDAREMLDELEAEAPDSGGSSAGSPGGSSGLRAVIKLSEQQVYVYDGSDAQLAKMPCSSGRDGLTPVGTFAVQSKSASTVSNSDPSISMDWMTRFNGSIGFHGIPVKGGQQLDTPLGEAPVSAGCVRMADADAKLIFDELPVGARVEVVY
jgi:lipoprotein-anchoring transpeptidase ErfK/SrfK